ncbi:hypothetical protein J7E49_20160 [Variovorax paradoxus]|nr:hypothetical protein [Variovorax paradoxus]
MSILIAVGVALLITVIGYLFRKKKIAKASALVDSRETLSFDEIFQNFYSSGEFDKTKIMELWGEIAQTLGVSEGKMRPTDRFGKEIGVYLITSEELDALAILAKKRATKNNLAVNIHELTTVDEYIRQFGKSNNPNS